MSPGKYSSMPPTMRWYIALLPLLVTTPSFAVTVQKPDLSLPESAAANRQAVKDIFLESYNAYK